MKIVLPGTTPSKKNSRNIFVRNGKVFNTPNSRYQTWATACLWMLKGRNKYTTKVDIYYVFYMGDKRRRDLDNCIASVNDVLVDAGIITDDNWMELSIAGAIGKLDTNNPRAEIFINESEEQTPQTVGKNS